MANPVLRGFQSLHRFSGRDTAGQFWPYAAVVVIAVFAIMAIAMPIAMQSVFSDMQQFAAKHPEAATVQTSPTSYSISIDAGHPDAPPIDLSGLFLALGAAVVLAVVLLAAAVSRRLHDCNRPAYFGLAPVVFLVGALVLFPRMMADFSTSTEPDLRLFGLLFLNNALYLAALFGLVIQCILKGTPGPNRYGPELTAVS